MYVAPACILSNLKYPNPFVNAIRACPVPSARVTLTFAIPYPFESTILPLMPTDAAVGAKAVTTAHVEKCPTTLLNLKMVETHRSRICQKLNLQGSHALMKFAVQYRSLL